jgi:SP family myo-inositol transporter-like MFS transporter 13
LSLAVIYSYGGFTATTSPLRSGDAGEVSLHIDRQSSLPSSKI